MRGDQLAYLSQADAKRAAKELASREMIVTFCSECDEDDFVIWQVKRVEARDTGYAGYYQVHLTGRPLVRSSRKVRGHEAPSMVPKQFVAGDEAEEDTIGLDLAYTYVLKDGWWVCAGKHFKLECEVRIERFKL